MIGWRARLAARRVTHAPAVSAESADRSGSPSEAEAICTNGTSGNGRENAAAIAQPDLAARIAFYRRAMEEAAEALAAPDPDLDAERVVMARHYAERSSISVQADARHSHAGRS